MFAHVTADARRAVVHAADLAWLQGDDEVSLETLAEAFHAVLNYQRTGDLGALPLLAEELPPEPWMPRATFCRNAIDLSEAALAGLRLADLHAAMRGSEAVDIEDWATALRDHPALESVIARLRA